MYHVDDRFYLVDLPGYGYARASRAERRDVSDLLRAYLSERDRLAGVVWLLDVRRDPSPEDAQIAGQLTGRGTPVLATITKGDKLGRGRRRERTKRILDAVGIPEDQCVVTSVRKREGIEELREAIEGLVGRSGGRAVGASARRHHKR